MVSSELYRESLPAELTYHAEMLKGVQGVAADLEPHRPVESLPPLEDAHQQVHYSHLDEFVAAEL